MNDKIRFIASAPTAPAKPIVAPATMQIAPSQAAQVQPRQLSRRERKIREAELKRRMRKHRPLIRGDYRWKKLTEQQKQACVNTFKNQLAEALRTLQASFTFSYPKTAEFDEVIKNYPAIILQQTADYEWTVMLPQDNGYTALNWQVDEAFSAGADYCVIHAEGVDLDKLAADNKLIKQVFKDNKHANIYGILLQNTESEIIKQIDKHGELTVDCMLAIETIRRRTKRTVVYDKETIELLANEYDDILQNIDVETGADGSYRLTFTYIEAPAQV